MITIGLYLLSGVAVFLSILYWAIIIDVLLSWLAIFGVQVIIGPLVAITQPLYESVRKILPTQLLGGLDIAPIIIIVVINLIQSSILPRLITTLQ